MTGTELTKQLSFLFVELALVAFCSCATRSISFAPAGDVDQSITARDESASPITNQGSPSRININKASIAELMDLPGIGRVFAERIVAHREQYGRFKRVEHLMMVRGISDRRFRKIRDFITAE